jgi:hypothetical protein
MSYRHVVEVYELRMEPGRKPTIRLIHGDGLCPNKEKFEELDRAWYELLMGVTKP